MLARTENNIQTDTQLLREVDHQLEVYYNDLNPQSVNGGPDTPARNETSAVDCGTDVVEDGDENVWTRRVGRVFG